jgi:hypothetical protein
MDLKQQQAQMLSTIFSLNAIQEISSKEQRETLSAGMKTYQYSLLANASRALAITFATVHSFIGETGFTRLVKKYLQTHLKAQYDWGELGLEFADFIRHQSLQNNNVLAAIADLDFACHHTERAKDVNKDLTTLSLLNDFDAYQLTINFSAGFKLLKLNYPVDFIIENIKQVSEINSQLTSDDIAIELNDAAMGEYYFVTWRPNFQAQYQQITSQEYQWLMMWQKVPSAESTKQSVTNQQLSIGSALDKVANDEFSIVDWLPKAIELQLLQSIAKIVPD